MPARGTSGGALTITAVLVVGLLAGCTAGPSHPGTRAAGRSQVDAAPPVARASTAQILARSWASNGTRGFFVDVGGSPGSSMSLYDTAWWTAALVAAATPPARVDSRSVAAWLLPILYGA